MWRLLFTRSTNCSVVKIGLQRKQGQLNAELYKQLEIHTLESEKYSQNQNRNNLDDYGIVRSKAKSWIPNNKVSFLAKSNNPVRKRHVTFTCCMRFVLIVGQFFGLNPVDGIFENDATKIRFSVKSWKFFYTLILCSVQALTSALCFVRLFRVTIDFSGLSFVIFYGSVCLTTILFLRIGLKWPELVSVTLLSEEADPPTDTKLKRRINFAAAIILTMAILEHLLSILSRLTELMECFPELRGESFKGYSEQTFPWLYELNIPFSLPLGIFLQLLNIYSTMNWNYSDLFIICLSFYLASRLEQVCKKIHSTRGRILPPSYWRKLREDYTRITQLVRHFDGAIGSIVFVSFSSNLFFICLQLFNNLSKGMKRGIFTKICTEFGTGPFKGYEHATYFSVSLSFLILRSLAVSLAAARVNSATLVVAPALYDVPSEVYCNEVQRFLEQVHGDRVALSGLGFFYVTRGLVLTVAGTIVTYELVLLQFAGAVMTDD